MTGQTRLSSPELTPPSGAVTGTYTSTKLRDINSARDHGNGQTNGIASSISACGTSVSCSILVPPSYGIAEQVPGYTFDPTTAAAVAATSGNITIFDRRTGDSRMAVNPAGFQDGLVTTPNGWVYDYYSKAGQSSVLAPFYILQNSWDGGNNQQNTALNYADKTQWTPLSLEDNSYTPAQHLTMGATTYSTSVGDVIGNSNHVYCWGGFNAQGDQGCRAADNHVLQGNVEYAGTLTGSPVSNGTTVTVAPTQGANTQGAGRFLIRTNSGLISAGTISGITSVNNALTSLTGSGTAWPVSQVVAQLGTSVSAPGAATVAPSNFTTGSLSLIQTSTLVCVADQLSFEMVYPTAVTATGFTALFSKEHLPTATIATGGVCGYLLNLTADNVTNSTYSVHTQTITGTLHFAWPMVSSSSATAANFWVAGGGAYQQLVSRWNANTANGYVMYPFAEVTSVQQGGGPGNTLTLSPNNVAWSTGDTVAELLYPAVDIRIGNNLVESYYPNLAPTGNNFGFTYNSPLQGSDAMLTLTNNTPAGFYAVNGGKMLSPWGLHLSGETKNGIFVDIPSDQWTFGVGCSLPCSSTQNIVAVGNPNYYDFVQYDQANARWSLSAGSNYVHYTFGGTHLFTPFPALFLAADGGNNGYLATNSLRSGAAANTDITGELALNNSATATYTFLAAYGSHPECLLNPQIDMGSTNRHWITYSGTGSFTVNFATAITGTVTYSCTARN